MNKTLGAVTSLQIVSRNGGWNWEAFTRGEFVERGTLRTTAKAPSKKTLAQQLPRELPSGALDPQNWFRCRGVYCWESPDQ